MAIHAYSEIYLDSAQNILGHSVDFAVMSLNIKPDTFGDAFMISNAGKQFALGNPRYVSGMNGCELARTVLTETGIPFADTDDAMYLDKSPEYWAGWALAYYEWHKNISFEQINNIVPISDVVSLYDPLHEADIMKFVEVMDARIRYFSEHLGQGRP